MLSIIIAICAVSALIYYINVANQRTKGIKSEDASKYFKYDRDVGGLRWKAVPPKDYTSKINDLVSVGSNGFVKTCFGTTKVYNIIWYLETGNWPIHPLYHKDGDINNNHIDNLTLRNPQWARGVKVGKDEVLVSILFKDGEWYVKVSNQFFDLIGPFPDMNLASKEMARIAQKLAHKPEEGS